MRRLTMDPSNARRSHPPAAPWHERGQSLVEFALVLPILLLLLLVSLDFGRVFLGYINVQNMARIAANYAANNPNAWGATPNAAIQTKYQNQVLADASASNCELPRTGGAPVVPDPAFSDVDGDGDASGLGDNARVQISCSFGIITPIISDIIGKAIEVTAESNFPVKTGMSTVAGGGGGGGGGTPILPTAAFIANDVVSSRTTPYPVLNDIAPFDVEFRDTSGGGPNAWNWDFGDGTPHSALQDPLVHTFNCPGPALCTYTVTMVASNGNGSSTAHMTIEVQAANQVNFTASKTLLNPGEVVVFNDASTAGGTNWTWTFGDGTAPVSGTNTSPTHTYTAAGTYTVSLSVTYPTGDVTATKTDYVRVELGLCTVPDLSSIGLRFNDAQAKFTQAGFTGLVKRDTGAPAGNFVINAQDLTSTSLAACASDIKVTNVKP